LLGFGGLARIFEEVIDAEDTGSAISLNIGEVPRQNKIVTLSVLLKKANPEDDTLVRR
jgi:hypothetical protein